LEKVKERYKQKLTDDFKRYTKQIGIRSNEMPKLVTDRNEIEELKQNGNFGRGTSTSNNLGVCYRKQRIIYVNGGKRKLCNRPYAHVKYTYRQLHEHKVTYRDFLEILVHELVHYRFDYLKHGAKFEQRIREILAGRVFPEKSLFDDDTSQPSDKNVTPIPIETIDFTPILTPEPTLTKTIDYESKYKELLERYNKLDLDWMRLRQAVVSLSKLV
jgi:hypothetical protein